MRGRHSCAMLKTLGITETIAHTGADYINVAVRLARKADWQQQVIAKMRDRHTQLFDETDCIHALEAFYREAIAQHQANPSQREGSASR